MTIAELIADLATRLDSEILDGDPAASFAKARDGTHANPLAGAALKAMIDGAGCESASAEVHRAQAVTALGPLRLEAMRNDAPVDALRFIEQFVQAIDAAFNEEALRSRNTS